MEKGNHSSRNRLESKMDQGPNAEEFSLEGGKYWQEKKIPAFSYHFLLGMVLNTS